MIPFLNIPQHRVVGRHTEFLHVEHLGVGPGQFIQHAVHVLVRELGGGFHPRSFVLPPPGSSPFSLPFHRFRTKLITRVITLIQPLSERREMSVRVHYPRD